MLKNVALLVIFISLAVYGQGMANGSTISTDEAVEKCKSMLISAAAANPSSADPSRAQQDMNACMAGYGKVRPFTPTNSNSPATTSNSPATTSNRATKGLISFKEIPINQPGAYEALIKLCKQNKHNQAKKCVRSKFNKEEIADKEEVGAYKMNFQVSYGPYEGEIHFEILEDKLLEISFDIDNENKFDNIRQALVTKFGECTFGECTNSKKENFPRSSRVIAEGTWVDKDGNLLRLESNKGKYSEYFGFSLITKFALARIVERHAKLIEAATKADAQRKKEYEEKKIAAPSNM